MAKTGVKLLETSLVANCPACGANLSFSANLHERLRPGYHRFFMACECGYSTKDVPSPQDLVELLDREKAKYR